jgi:hypothetical protein
MTKDNIKHSKTWCTFYIIDLLVRDIYALFYIVFLYVFFIFSSFVTIFLSHFYRKNVLENISILYSIYSLNRSKSCIVDT